MYWVRRKLLSQNFLRNRELIKTLVRSSSIGKTDIVLEIGPGRGIITRELLGLAGKVIAIELDEHLYHDLKNEFEHSPNLQIYNSDFLSLELPTGPYKIFSNIPFRLTSDIIRKLLMSSDPPRDTYLIVQKEAAEKLTGNNLTPLLCQPWFEFSVVHEFVKTDFVPAPKVETVLLRIKKRSNPLIASEKKTLYENFMTYVFSQRKPRVVKLPGKLARINLSQWISLFDHFVSLHNTAKLNLIKGSASKLVLEQQNLRKIHRTRNDRNWKKFLKSV